MEVFSIALFLFLSVGITLGQKEQKMSFSSPELSEEEMHSQHMPANLKCDACTAVAYQMTELLKKGEKSKGNKKMKESDYLDVFEKICHPSTFEGYGIKPVNNVNRLSGKGVEADDVPGMLMGGGKWPNRLSTKCFEFIDQLGEDDIYERFHEKRALKEYLCRQVTKDCLKTDGKKTSEKEL